MPPPTEFKLDRTQRLHRDRLVVRVFQVIGSGQFGWDTNQDEAERLSRHATQEDAQREADESIARAGHVCDESCYTWRALS